MSCFAGSGKPRIAILMAVYEPRLDWLREQMLSLNAQTYCNLALYIRDDCSPTVSFEQICDLARECVTKFPYTIQRNEKNLGSTGTFQRLTQEAEGCYFAYCDQDDVWLPEKLEVLQKELDVSGALLVCSDMFIIDERGRQVADSMTKIRRRHVFYSGAGLAEGLLFHNFVTGCTMLIRAEAAKAAVPFCPYMVHDHYLALWCANQGELLSLPTPLIRYRVHDENQTGLMAGVTDKKSYLALRIEVALNKMRWLEENFPASPDLREKIIQGTEWLDARQGRFAHRRGCVKTIWKYRQFSPLTSLFEVVAAGFPDQLFMVFIGMNQKNWV